ncbi:cohesin domain-containing protein [Candidatus Parcubacteria bacterium]|nr:cohesin domain-containing protein [Patescibacteria group bacterium]MBU4309411.1 cohesin domain-containing protein [Patescibacteria group bacterium]MBU4431966.1 cohesin domain-containing protein [Patescibacteria group bacterium]MBU4577772.1 cohesin domain-containing protein [Patescibacteria group bacterium]MCG2697457.1 cohesin domain-containing protein [Candidatus Parcubacteria bacterium]
MAILPWLGSPVSAAGATLFVSPSTGSYDLGKNFTVKVMINSGGGVGINAGEGSLKYDSSALLVTAVSKGSSIFNLWTTEPTYSNTAGTITFGGGSPSSYKGTAGEVFSVTFSTKKVGDTNVTFTSGTILAADGRGTNIFSGFGNAKFTIKEAAKKEEPKKEEPKKETPTTTGDNSGLLPPLPEISSKTHQETTIWYQNNKPEFIWKLLPDLVGINYVIDSKPTTDPGTTMESVIESKIFENTKDGEWYFHLKYKNKAGWSQPSHRKFMIDVTPPENFSITVDTGGDTTNPAPRLRFRTKDVASGIDHYTVKIDNKLEQVKPEEVDKGYYQLTPLEPGERKIEITAIDKANNIATSAAMFMIDPLRAPIISSIPKLITKAEDLVIQGTSFYPRVTVKIFIASGKNDPEEFTTKTDDSGNWSYFHNGRLAKGNYDIWAKIIDDRGAQSLNSSKNLLTLQAPSLVDQYGVWVIIVLLIIIMLLSLYIHYVKKKFFDEKTRIKSETTEVKMKLGKIFAALREEVDELMQMADKKPGLSESERRVKEKLQESLDISEEFINKEVEDVEKEIKLPKVMRQ